MQHGHARRWPASPDRPFTSRPTLEKTSRQSLQPRRPFSPLVKRRRRRRNLLLRFSLQHRATAGVGDAAFSSARATQTTHARRDGDWQDALQNGIARAQLGGRRPRCLVPTQAAADASPALLEFAPENSPLRGLASVLSARRRAALPPDTATRGRTVPNYRPRVDGISFTVHPLGS